METTMNFMSTWKRVRLVALNFDGIFFQKLMINDMLNNASLLIETKLEPRALSYT